MADLFTVQQRADAFCRALGSFAHGLDRNAELDRLLDQAARFGWDPERIGHYIAGRLPANARSGLVVLSLRTLSAAPEPTKPTDHQLQAVARAKVWRQPIRPCGQCDGSPARWLDVTPAGHNGQPMVIHCPACWTPPPGYVEPAERHARNRERYADA